MKINVTSSEGVSDISVFLTESEADDLARSLPVERLDGEPGYRGPGYSMHIEDGEGSELTIESPSIRSRGNLHVPAFRDDA